MRLEPCPSSPNCISSEIESSDKQHYMQAIDVAGPPAVVIEAVSAVVGDSPGAKITSQTDDRVDAVFTTRIFRFKDDVSFVVDGGKLHFRSASRTGHSDLGANRKRLQALLPLIKAKL